MVGIYVVGVGGTYVSNIMVGMYVVGGLGLGGGGW